MTIVPQSGKAGFVYWTLADPLCIPIYSWSFNQVELRPTYITSRTNNLPIRSPGVIDGRLTITGASATGIDLNQFFGALLINPVNELIVGWHEFSSAPIGMPTGLDRYYKVQGMLSEFHVNYNYIQSAEPGFVWTASFVNSEIRTLTPDEQLFLTVDEPPICFTKPCTFQIRTSDLTHNAGVLKHVHSLSYNELYPLPNYRTSRQSPVVIQSVIDRTVSMVVTGDFDYWFDMMLESPSPKIFDYGFYYGPGVSDYFPLERGVLNSIDNFLVNVRSGELISATVNLGVAG